MKIIKNNILPPKGYSAITIFPFILTRKDSLGERTIRHENIHGKQQIELLIIFFLLWYFIEWLIRLIQYKFNTNKAYRNISFEREAYANEDVLNYLEIRKFWSFTKYLWI